MEVVVLGERLKKKMKRELGGRDSLEIVCVGVKMKNESVFMGEGPRPLYGRRWGIFA